MMDVEYSSSPAVWAAGTPPNGHRQADARDMLKRAIALGLRRVQRADHVALFSLDDRELAAANQRARAAGVAVDAGGRGLTKTTCSRCAWSMPPTTRRAGGRRHDSSQPQSTRATRPRLHLP